MVGDFVAPYVVRISGPCPLLRAVPMIAPSSTPEETAIANDSPNLLLFESHQVRCMFSEADEPLVFANVPEILGLIADSSPIRVSGRKRLAVDPVRHHAFDEARFRPALNSGG